MKSTVEPAEGNKVKVAVSVSETELEPAIDVAWREIAKEVRLPGFRPGKAPRRLLEKQFGNGYARSEALRSAVPDFYSRAVIEHDVDVIDAPELEITSGEEEGDVEFSAVVAVRPSVEVPGYQALKVTVPRPNATDAEVDEQIDRLRSQHGEMATVERAVEDGDYVTIDISGTSDGEDVEGLTADDYMYLVGSKMIAPEFDEYLVGATADSEVTFEADHPDPSEGRVEFTLRVKEVKERVLPELTDEWVADATEFETVTELRDDTLESLSSSREAQTRDAVRARLGAALAELVEDEVPDSLVSSETQARLQSLAYQLQGNGLGLEDYLRITGRDPESFAEELRAAAEEAVKVDLALRAVVLAEGLEVSDEELDEEILSMLAGTEMELDEARDELRDGGQLSAIRSDLAKRKAIEWLVEQSEIVDEDGNTLDEDLLRPAEESDDPHAGHDHDHDHD